MADAEDKLIDHLKQLWADNIALHAKVEGFSLGSEGATMLQTHHAFKNVAKKIMKYNHKIGHAIRYLDELPPASIERIQELSEIKDADEVPDVEEINRILQRDFETVLSRATKAHNRASDTDNIAVKNILSPYCERLSHWIWHCRATQANQKPEQI